ncbi:MAG: type II toxin-antitoxin system VapC family toxin [Rectinemataceae bacterium]
MILDTGIVVAYLIREEGWESLEPLLVDERSLQTDILPLELANAVVSLVRKKRCTPELGMELWKAWDAIGMPIVPTGHLVGDALEVSLRTQTRPYDMIHVLAAAENDDILVTLDRRLILNLEGTPLAERVRHAAR